MLASIACDPHQQQQQQLASASAAQELLPEPAKHQLFVSGWVATGTQDKHKNHGWPQMKISHATIIKPSPAGFRGWACWVTLYVFACCAGACAFLESTQTGREGSEGEQPSQLYLGVAPLQYAYFP